MRDERAKVGGQRSAGKKALGAFAVTSAKASVVKKATADTIGSRRLAVSVS